MQIRMRMKMRETWRSQFMGRSAELVAPEGLEEHAEDEGEDEGNGEEEHEPAPARVGAAAVRDSGTLVGGVVGEGEEALGFVASKVGLGGGGDRGHWER